MIDFREIKGLLKLHLDDEPLMRAQLDAMERQVPLLYLILLTSIATLAFAMRITAPSVLTLLFPSVVTFIIVYRLFAWAITPKDNVPTHLVVRKLKILVGVAVVVTVLLCGWSALLARHAVGSQFAHIAVFTVVTILATAFSLAPLGLAALVGIVIGGFTIMATGLLLNDQTLLAIAGSFCLILCVVVVLIGRWNASFASDVRSREALKKLNEETQNLNHELRAHKSHLEDLVEVRTHELAQQTLKLEQALASERELNEMQNKFVSMVSHEFRTPLAIIDGMARRVQSKSGEMSSDDVAERMLRIRGAVDRLSGLVERSIDASRLASSHFEYVPGDCSLSDILNEVIERQKDISPDCKFQVELEFLPETLQGDAQLLEHVFSNIVGNAVKYSQKNPLVIVHAWSDEESCSVTVRDHGVGIPEDEIEKVLEPYYRASTSTGIAGTGIGLHLVRDLINMHQGRLSISSEVGEWTEFRVDLPVASEQAEIEHHKQTG